MYKIPKGGYKLILNTSDFCFDCLHSRLTVSFLFLSWMSRLAANACYFLSVYCSFSVCVWVWAPKRLNECVWVCGFDSSWKLINNRHDFAMLLTRHEACKNRSVNCCVSYSIVLISWFQYSKCRCVCIYINVYFLRVPSYDFHMQRDNFSWTQAVKII